MRQHQNITLRCGHHNIDRNSVALATQWARIAPGNGSDVNFSDCFGYQNANLMWNQNASLRSAPFLGVLQDTRSSFQATDPRDKVFAMLHQRVYYHVVDDHGQVIEKTRHPGPSHEVSKHSTCGAITDSHLDNAHPSRYLCRLQHEHL